MPPGPVLPTRSGTVVAILPDSMLDCCMRATLRLICDMGQSTNHLNAWIFDVFRDCLHQYKISCWFSLCSEFIACHFPVLSIRDFPQVRWCL